MNKKFITEFVSGKSISETNDLKIQEMINLFPYCETIRKIDLFIKNKNEDITFEEVLPKTAIYSSNRKSLFLLLMKKSHQILLNENFKKDINLNNTTQTFHSWLKTSSSNNSSQKKIIENKKNTIIENENTDDLMTETLAKLYLEQHHFDQAIRAYKILRLKYPKKSSLFASEIKKITKLKLKNE